MILHYTADGYLVLLPKDDPRKIVDSMLITGYNRDFCISPDFSPGFIARLMEAGFLVMSARLDDDPGEDSIQPVTYVLLPKLHLVRSALFFENLHIKKSIRCYLDRYELRFDSDFETIVDRCVQVHGDDWLTPPLVTAIKKIREQRLRSYPASFALYRDRQLVAGEFGVIVDKVYTSYSGYYNEGNAGTVQLIKTTHYLKEHGFIFFDLGMPLPYKTDLGAVDIGPQEFVSLFRHSTGLAVRSML
jgi:Leu/Phe-tRNA-protein transferase